MKGMYQDYDLISMRYRCKVCKTTFLASEERSIETLPDFIKKQVPFLLTKKKGYLKEVASMVGKSVLRGMSINGFTDVCSEMSAEEYEKRHQVYLNYAVHLRDAGRSRISKIRNGNFRVEAAEERQIQPFGQKQLLAAAFARLR